jgi:hypothetical protein
MNTETMAVHSRATTFPVERLTEAWHGEMEAQALYVRLARREQDPEKAAVLANMAEAKIQHRVRIERRLRQLGAIPPNPAEFWLPIRLRMRARLAPRDRVLAQLAASEYVSLDSTGDEVTDQLLRSIRG